MPSEQKQKLTETVYKQQDDMHFRYRPFSCEAVGNPCLEVGDGIRFSTRYELVESYILKRTLKGIQGLRDSYAAEGNEEYSEKVNSVSKSIIQLKGKTNTLTRTVDETVSEIYAYDENGNRYSRIEQNEEEIKQEVSARTKEGEETRASLALKINNDDDGTIISLIEGSADKIHFNANNFFTVDSPNFKIDEDGNAEFSGKVKGAVISGGEITGTKINNGNGTFSVDKNGNLTVKSARIEGNLSGSTINNGNNNFVVDKNGNAEMKSATITGGSFNINDNFIVDTDGNAQMKSATITGGSFNINNKFMVDKSGNAEMKSVTIVNKINLKSVYDKTKPNIENTYKFADTQYDGSLSGEILIKPDSLPFFNIYSPTGKKIITIGNGIYNEDPDDSKTRDVAFFPNGAMINNAHINSLYYTFKEEENLIESGREELGDTPINSLTYKVRKSGAFVCFAGTYRPYVHAKNDIRYFVLSNISKYLPTNHSVRTIGYSHGRLILFQLTPQGELRAINIGDDIEISPALEINFRFDYFIFP